MLFTNYSQLKYYNFCDCIYKYQIKSVLQVPSCFKVLAQCAVNRRIHNISELLPLLLFFYILFFRLPKIYFQVKSQSLPSHNIRGMGAFEVKKQSSSFGKLILFCSFKKIQVYSFLHQLFLRFWHGDSFLKIKVFNKVYFTGSILVPAAAFFFDKGLRLGGVNKYVFFLKFFFNSKNFNLNKFYNQSYFLYNFFFFWSLIL